MHFCVIAPTRELDRYAARSKYHLVLAQYAAADAAYFEWYRGRAAAGEWVILDSGGYEDHRPDIDEYIRLAQELRPRVITVPDVVGDPKESKRLAFEFQRVYCSGAAGFPMAVVQHYLDASLCEWVAEYRRLVEVFNFIAFPRALRDRRVELIASLHRLELWDNLIFHHAFGMNAGSLEELPQLNALGVHTCDSSAPVWRGLHGYHINSTTPWPDYPFNPAYVCEDEPDAVGAEDLRKLADYNLTEVLNACQSRSATPSYIKAGSISSVR